MRIRACFLLLILLCGCSALPVNQNEVSSADTPALEMGYDYRLLPEMAVFSGKSLQFTYSVQNLSVPIEVGVMMFFDGIAQNYAVDGETGQAVMHRYELQGNQEKVLSFAFTPKYGTTGKHKLMLVTMLNPSAIIDINNPQESFGNNHKITNAGATIIFEQDYGIPDLSILSDFSSSKISDEERSLFDIPESSENALDEITFFYLYQGENPFATDKAIWYNGNEKLHMSLRGLGGPSGEYRITVFRNHVPLKIADNFDLMEAKFSGGYAVEKQIVLDTSSFQRNDVLYAIAIPLSADEAYDFSVKTVSRMLIPN
ncbi:MAG: hypothetical protein LBT44_02940 [Clostridiales bacterium]|jgi:hypothetical protein|nr:hypothetical protein [Clostridiales bacterium]